MRPMTYTLENLTKSFGVTIPSRFKKFIETGEFKAYQKKMLRDLPFSSYGTKESPIFFANRNLFDDRFFHIDQKQNPGMVPLAILGGNDNMQLDFLTIDLCKTGMPVYLCKPDEIPAKARSTYILVAKSFDDFLSTISV